MPETNEDTQTQTHAKLPDRSLRRWLRDESEAWNNRSDGGRKYQNIAVERSFKREGDTEYTTHTVNIAPDKVLSVARALEKGHDTIVEKQTSRGQSR